MRPVRFLLGIAAATGVSLGFASPAYAAELELTDSHQRGFAPAGSLLATATAEVERGTRLIIQAARAGTPAPPAEPTPTPTATPTPPAGTPAPAPSGAIPAAPPAPTGSAVPPPAGEDSPPRDEDLPGLAVTGAQVGGMVVLGSGLLSAGVALVAVRRRRFPPDLLDGAAD